MGQLGILETMTPLQFLDFRDALFPASGFQSVQFRLIENTLGLEVKNRMAYGKRSYCTYLREDHGSKVEESEGKLSLLRAVEKWLERTPFLEMYVGVRCVVKLWIDLTKLWI